MGRKGRKGVNGMNENVYAFATKTNAGIMKGCVRAASGGRGER